MIHDSTFLKYNEDCNEMKSQGAFKNCYAIASCITNWHVKSAGFIHKPSIELEPRYLSMIPILGALLNLVIFKLTNYLPLFLSNIDHISQLGKAKCHRMRQLKDQTPYQHCSKPGGQPSDLPIQIKLCVFQTRERIWKSGTYKSINKFLASIVMDKSRG